MRSPWQKIWPAVLTAALLGMALYSALYTLRSIWSSYRVYRTGMDGPSIWSVRMARLDQALPAGFGIIGYLSERDVPGLSFDPIDQDEEYVMTQYFLAPRVVEEGANRPLVVTNIASSNVAPADIESHFDLLRVKSYGWGISLYKQATP